MLDFISLYFNSMLDDLDSKRLDLRFDFNFSCFYRLFLNFILSLSIFWNLLDWIYFLYYWFIFFDLFNYHRFFISCLRFNTDRLLSFDLRLNYFRFIFLNFRNNLFLMFYFLLMLSLRLNNNWLFSLDLRLDNNWLFMLNFLFNNFGLFIFNLRLFFFDFGYDDWLLFLGLFDDYWLFFTNLVNDNRLFMLDFRFNDSRLLFFDFLNDDMFFFFDLLYYYNRLIFFDINNHKLLFFSFFYNDRLWWLNFRMSNIGVLLFDLRFDCLILLFDVLLFVFLFNNDIKSNQRFFLVESSREGLIIRIDIWIGYREFLIFRLFDYLKWFLLYFRVESLRSLTDLL